MQTNIRATNEKKRRADIPTESPIPLASFPDAGRKSGNVPLAFEHTPNAAAQDSEQMQTPSTSYKRARIIFVAILLVCLLVGFVLLVIQGFAALVYMLALVLAFAVIKRKHPQILNNLKKPKLAEKSELNKDDFVEIIDNVFNVDTMLVSQNLSSVKEILINKPVFVLGASEECDGVLNMDSGISRKHFRILFAKIGGLTTYYVEDLGSRNGTWLNGQRLTANAPQAIVYGDEITIIGKLKFAVRSTSY